MTAIRLSDSTGKRARREFTLSALAAFGLLASVAGVVDVLFPDLLAVGRPGAFTAVAVAVLFGAHRAWPRPVQQTYTTPGVTIRVVEGDLLAQPGHLVIGMTDTFDTDTATGVIAAGSVQGQFLDRIYGGDRARLDADLATALAATPAVGHVDKPGNTVRYPVGTVATLGGHARRYFCTAYTSMTETNEARGDVDGVWTSLSSLWEAVCAHGNSGHVSMAVIGGGQARLSQVLSPGEAIRLQVLSFWLACRKKTVCASLDIVLPADKYAALDRREIQAFLTSLKPS